MNRILTSRIARWSAASALAIVLATTYGTFSSHAAELDSGGLDVVKVRPDFYMIAGGGGNVGVNIGSDGVVLTNSGNAASSDLILAEIKKLTDLPIRMIINTDGGPEFVGGNAAIARKGLAVRTGSNLAEIIGHDSILQRMSARNANPSYPGDAWPNDAFLPNRHAVRMNDQGIEVLKLANGHNATDSAVLFRKSDVVAIGDIMDTTRFPVIDVANGGSINGEVEALNRVIDMTIAPIPYIYKDVGTYVIPGHGRVSEQMEVVDYRDMVVMVRDNVAALIKQGKTLDQIQAAHPAAAYETRYGKQAGVTNEFVESIYKSLTAKK